ncbi:phosphatidylinositol N-acetylglucosaminyltransferase subunit C-like isoform X3 [Dermacentor silvarum]|uniref:phosphatidylinositol N-acetylglucosaminyltransferase subunit C-like isoform X3 n=1 Tax=Dermacentor silvarum TaxID=543639 RepID=UPI0021018DE7|nr:phosphatidylinositol N-acetylglucosaminyltransferase subunit C-like isoform X3 [Dermacentor silvarum]
MEVPEQSWKKVLYDDQSVPDNYVDQSFLGQLRKNVNLVHFSLTEALYGVTGMVQQICRTVLFAVLFGHLQGGLLHPSELFVGLALLGWPTYLLYAFVQERKTGEVVEDLRRAAIFVAFGSSLAPIMGTLTETISTDTVYAMAAGALLLHVACHDYTPGSRTQGVCTAEAQEPASDDGRLWLVEMDHFLNTTLAMSIGVLAHIAQVLCFTTLHADQSFPRRQRILPLRHCLILQRKMRSSV